MELKDDLKRVHAKSQKNRGSNGPGISFFSEIPKKVPENQFLQNAHPADPSSTLKRSNARVFFPPALPTLLPHRHLTPLLAVTPPLLGYFTPERAIKPGAFLFSFSQKIHKTFFKVVHTSGYSSRGVFFIFE